MSVSIVVSEKFLRDSQRQSAWLLLFVLWFRYFNLCEVHWTFYQLSGCLAWVYCCLIDMSNRLLKNVMYDRHIISIRRFLFSLHEIEF